MTPLETVLSFVVVVLVIIIFLTFISEIEQYINGK